MWTPWLGDNYDRRRLLILGESAYSKDDPDLPIEHSINMVEWDLAEPLHAARFLTTISRGLCGKQYPSDAEVTAAWHTAAFTNYVPTSIGSASRQRPGRADWRAARDQWPALLELLAPRAVVVLGRSTWANMPPTDKFVRNDLQGYALGDRIVMCIAVRHPSAGLGWRTLADAIAEVQRQA